MKREVKELVASIAAKFKFDATKILRVTRVHPNGRHANVDNDVFRQIPDGQDMILELSPVKASLTDGRWAAVWDDIIENIGDMEDVPTPEGSEIKLIF